MSEQQSPAYEATLIEYGSFMVAGYTAEASEESDLSSWWERLNQQLQQGDSQLVAQRLAAVEKLQRVGVLMPDAEDAGYTYTAGFLLPGGIKDLAALGLTGLVVPAALYATVLVQGPILPGLPPAHIRAGFDYLSKSFIPAKGLEATGVCLEVYGPGQVTDPDYKVYLWQAVTQPQTPAGA
ncbi:MAG: hypothetical protein SOR40_04220 [Rothia sp. (in: high G+C Gram-positive bacteria)]|nr:hypothetical protein [Rothia sp. (in: high G+C Gram-positive bacteria)]